MPRKFKTIDANEAVANVAYRLNEVIAIYPITPSSAMGEWADQWASEGAPNIWGTVPQVIEMQSEGGAAGAVHGALQTGALATTFTASRGLLLMIPNMNKIAGELTPAVFHVSARTVATHALSIFGDHSDVMSCRTTGFAMLCSNSVQEAMDFALIAHAAALESRIPFLHFFDGFRTSHEVNKIEMLTEDDMRELINMDRIFEHRQRALSPESVVRAMFYGLGADGTVGANKNSIKIIGENTENYAQGYFVYDSKKSGAMTVSHLRFGPQPIRSSYLISKANFMACHQWVFLERYDMLRALVPSGVFLLNSPFGPDEVWSHLPREVQRQLIAKKAKFYVIDAYQVAREAGMGSRMNTIMQTCFFAISKVLPREVAIEAIRKSIRDTYGKKGEEVVQQNLRAVDETLAHLFEVSVPEKATSQSEMQAPFSLDAPKYEREVLGAIYAGHGDEMLVSAFPADGTFPTGTAKWEKRNLALDIPVWDTKTCIQCGKCAMVCPHAVIRMVYKSEHLVDAPVTFKFTDARDKEWKGLKYTIQVAPEDCTGCGICVDICPAKNKSETRLKAINMEPQRPLRAQESENWEFFLKIPELDRRKIKMGNIRQQQVQEPLFEFSGACSGCGETPYLKLVSQLFGDRAVMPTPRAAPRSFGGNLPTTPWAKNAEGRGPAWSNSLFEDNAEFGLGFRLLTKPTFMTNAREWVC